MTMPNISYEGEIGGLVGIMPGDFVYYIAHDGLKHTALVRDVKDDYIATGDRSYLTGQPLVFKISDGSALLGMDLSNLTVRATSYYPKAKRGAA